jgi:uncharacterized protein YjiS (DUF1127 family)
MKTYSLQEPSVLEKNHLNIESCCKNALDNLKETTQKQNVWKRLLQRIVHNWKTRSRLNSLSDAQMKDLGLTSSDIYNETNKPLWK